MKDKFITFMKSHHAFDEFKIDIFPYTMPDLDVQFKDGGAEFVLQDGAIFFWKDSKTGVDWEKLSKEWEVFCNGEAS